MRGIELENPDTGDTLMVPIAHDSLETEPDPFSSSEESITGKRQKTVRYNRDIETFETTHLTSSEVKDLEDFIVDSSNRVNVSGNIEGYYDITVEKGEYIFFYKNGSPAIAGQRVFLRLEDLEEEAYD